MVQKMHNKAIFVIIDFIAEMAIIQKLASENCRIFNSNNTTSNFALQSAKQHNWPNCYITEELWKEEEEIYLSHSINL